jgi:phosphohistidine phosphatase SixA
MARLGVHPDLVLTSPLARVIHDHRDSASLMLVGHEPDFSTIIAACTGGGRVECGKGSLARVDRERLVSPEGTLVWLLPAEALER